MPSTENEALGSSAWHQTTVRRKGDTMQWSRWSLGLLVAFNWTVSAYAQVSYRRGDSNADGVLNVSDSSHLLGFLFLGGPAPPCRDAADANDDGSLDISDAPASLGFLFLGGPAPAAPFPSCGTDPTDDGIGCESYPPCQQVLEFPRPQPDPCIEFGEPCESAVIGPYTMVSVPDGDGVLTTASHTNAEALELRWVAVGGDAVDLVISTPDGPSIEPLQVGAGIPSLRAANVLAAVVLVLNTRAQQDGKVAGAAPDSDGNHAGCDPNGWMGWADCSSCGACCDEHDACIDSNCGGTDDSGDLRECVGRELAYSICQLDPMAEDCDSLPRCSEDCMACHRSVVACFSPCLDAFDTGPGPSNCCSRDDCGEPQQCIFDGVVETDADRCLIPEAYSWGDPHLITFDRLNYDFQGVGEFILVRARDDDLEVHARTAPWRNSRHVSITTAVAMNVEGNRVAVYVNRTPLLRVNGVAIEFVAGTIELPGGGTIEIRGREYTVTWSDGSTVRIRSQGAYLDSKVRLSAHRRARVEGLLGDFDGSRETDLRIRGGALLGHRPTLSQLYLEYGESWRVTAGESLFEYFDGDSTESHTDRTFPSGVVTAANLSPVARLAAEEICAAAGVTDPVLLEACVVDVGFTGDASFAESAGAIEPPEESVENPGCESISVTWADWTSGSASEVHGDLDEVEVTLTGVIANPQVQGGVNFWASTPATFTSPGIVDDPPGTSDIIALIGGPGSGVQTLTFSSPVIGPVMAIFSLGRPGLPSVYDFDTPFEILNVGPGHFGNGSLTALEGDVLSGQEGYGLIRFLGVVSSVSWTMPVAENWHGIQVGRVNCR
jgi:hypothetical protein